MPVVPIDMQAGTDTLLARIVVVFGEARHTTRICLPITGGRGWRSLPMKVL